MEGCSLTTKEFTVEDLAGQVAGCSLCPLGAIRKSIVFGEGNSRSKLMLVGEAPGKKISLESVFQVEVNKNITSCNSLDFYTVFGLLKDWIKLSVESKKSFYKAIFFAQYIIS